jgi:hypothetical protein
LRIHAQQGLNASVRVILKEDAHLAERAMISSGDCTLDSVSSLRQGIDKPELADDNLQIRQGELET